MESKREDYIGDGVYVKYDGFGIWLFANDNGHPTDKIYIEPDVMAGLVGFAERIGWKFKLQDGDGAE